MLYIIFSLGIFLVAGFVVCFFFIIKTKPPVNKFNQDIECLKKEKELINAELKELAERALGFVPIEYYEQLDKKLREKEIELKVKEEEAGVLRSQVKKVEEELFYLEEVNKEIETSVFESQKQRELLEAQQNDIILQNEKIKEKLKDIIENTKPFLDKISGSQENNILSKKLDEKNLEIEQQIDLLQSKIELLNKNYLKLKEHYDSLDVEYAQFVEKS